MEITNKMLQLYIDYEPILENMFAYVALPYLCYTVVSMLIYGIEFHANCLENEIPILLRILYHLLKFICISITIILGTVYIIPAILIMVGFIKDLIILYL